MEDGDILGDVSTMRLYGGAVGVVSGAYSAWLALAGMGMQGGAGWLMALVGLVALAHGLALFTPAAEAIGGASGPLMIAYAVVMVLLQAWAGLVGPMGGRTGGMGGGMDGGMGGTTTAMAGGDAGMVALALLMLFSGLVMTLRREMLE